MSFGRRVVPILLLLPVAGACRDAKEPPSTLSSRTSAPTSPVYDVVATAVPSVSTPLGRATFVGTRDQTVSVKRTTPQFQVEVKAKPAMDVAMQSISFPVGSQSTWHTHPGPVFIIVAQGTMRFYESDDPTCTPVEKKAGEGFLDRGEHAHIARNETNAPAQTVVTYLVPQGVPLKTDQPRPGNCPF